MVQQLNASASVAADGSTPAAEQVEARGLVHNLLFSVLGQGGYVLAQLGVLSALGHFRGPEAIGEFGLALAITTPVFMLANMGVRTNQASDVRKDFAFAEYAGLLLPLALGAAFVSIALGLLLASSSGTFLIVLIVSITKAFEAISNLSYGAFQQAGRMDKVASSLLIRGALTVVAFATLLWLGVETDVAFVAQLVIWSILAVAYDYPRACRVASRAWVWPTWRRDRLRQLLKNTAPVGAGHFMNALMVSLPRLFIDRLLGLEAVGLFTAVGYFQQAATLVVNAVSQALVNQFARFRRDGEEKAMRAAILTLMVAATLTSVLGLLLVHYAGGAILAFLFGPEFRSMDDLLMLIALAVSAKLFSALPQSLMHADRRFGAYFWYQAASLGFCVALLAVLVPLWGLMGAGYAVVAVALFRLAVLTTATAMTRRDPRHASESIGAATKVA